MAVRALALTLGLYTLVVCKGEVDDPSVGGRHGVEWDGPTVGDGALGHTFGERGQLARPPFAVLLDIQHDAGRASFASPQREVDEELEGAQGLAPVADKQAGIVALDINDGHLFAVAGTAYGGCGVHVHPVEEAPHDAQSGSGGAVPAHDAPDADPGVFRADAEDATPPLANDVDFDFVATDAELQGCELDCLLHRLR